MRVGVEVGGLVEVRVGLAVRVGVKVGVGVGVMVTVGVFRRVVGVTVAAGATAFRKLPATQPVEPDVVRTCHQV